MSNTSKKAVPIIVVAPCGYIIPFASLEMTAAYFVQTLQRLGKEAKYLDYRYIRSRLTTGENTFEGGPLKGWSFYECKSYEEQRDILNNNIPALNNIISNGEKEQENKGVMEKEIKREIEKERNRGDFQANIQANSQPNFQANFQHKRNSLLDNCRNVFLIEEQKNEVM